VRVGATVVAGTNLKSGILAALTLPSDDLLNSAVELFHSLSLNSLERVKSLSWQVLLFEWLRILSSSVGHDDVHLAI